MPEASASHLVLIPSYNTGEKLFETVAAARAAWTPVWVVLDGSTDGTAERLLAIARHDPGLRVLRLEHNQGKGAAILHGLRAAAAAGYSHVLTMDSDGQHPAERIGEFMARSMRSPDAMVLGVPQFDASAPRERIIGRKISNFWANVETLFAGIGDVLFGMRVYPLRPLLEVMEASRSMRRFDFDTETVVRLSWRGLPTVSLPATVRYLRAEEGGVSHYRYGRDNVLLVGMHLRLLGGFLLRLPLLLWRRLG
jgi:glycosyltransferase involved in cell wall biosynthesis